MLLPHKYSTLLKMSVANIVAHFSGAPMTKTKKSLMTLQPATRQRRPKVGTSSESRNLRGADVIKMSPSEGQNEL
jgi:hypothetical protein